MVKTTSIISILVWNHPEYTDNLLKNLQEYKISKHPYEVYILDQNSNEKTKQVLSNTQLPIHLVTLEKNIGFSKGHNLLLKKASEVYSFDYLCLLNSDIILEEDYWLDKLNEGLNKSPKNAIAGPSGVKIIMTKENYCDGMSATEADLQSGNFDLISGSLFSVKMSVIKKLKLFDEVFTPAYFEDADLNLRYKKNGFELVYVPLKHQHDYLQIKTPEERLKHEELVKEFGNYYQTNKALFIKRWESKRFMREKNQSKIMSKIIGKLKSFLKAKKLEQSNDKLQDKFTEIFDKNLFYGKESVSGTGSDLIQTEIITAEIPKLLKKYSTKTFIDAPCGDFFWMNLVDLSHVNYIGLDIVEAIIDRNSKLYPENNRKFIRKNIVSDKLPDADIILIRDCLVHLNDADIFKCIMNLKRSNIKYLLTTSFTDLKSNHDLIPIWRPLNLQLAPFNFPEPLEIINEGCTEDNGKYKDKSLILWEISKLPDFAK